MSREKGRRGPCCSPGGSGDPEPRPGAGVGADMASPLKPLHCLPEASLKQENGVGGILRPSGL